MNRYLFLLKRIAGYALGFLLFYEPFSYFYELLAPFFPPAGFTSIHVPCSRIPLYAIVGGGLEKQDPVTLFFCILLVITSLLLGPVFCGGLCPTGAFGEALSSLVPEKYQLNWHKLVPVLPLRYGFFAGFLFSSVLGIGKPCIYCNYYSLELFVKSILLGRLATTATALVATFFVAFILLGMWTKGGRGYCNLLCPVGTASMLLHALGDYLPCSMGMRVKQNTCIGCGSCARACPMQAIALENKKAKINIQHCITCGKCQQLCPKKAICYGLKGDALSDK